MHNKHTIYVYGNVYDKILRKVMTVNRIIILVWCTCALLNVYGSGRSCVDIMCYVMLNISPEKSAIKRLFGKVDDIDQFCTL